MVLVHAGGAVRENVQNIIIEELFNNLKQN